jgi:Cytidylate kinase-like family
VPIRVVAISRTPGAAGEIVGRAVSQRLGYRYVDEEIITAVAARQGVDPTLVADQERRRRLAERLVAGLARAGVDAGSAAYLPDTSSVRGSDDFRKLILAAIAETAEQGEVVIVAHAASMALAERDDLLRVFVTASPGRRSERLVEEGVVDSPGAAKQIKEDDAARADYLRRFHSIQRELPTHYDLVINTDRLDPHRAAEIVVSAAGR